MVGKCTYLIEVHFFMSYNTIQKGEFVYMRKCDYRSYFANVKKYVKLTPLCKEIGVSQSALSRFLMGDAYDYVISIETLNKLYQHLQNTLLKIV